MPEPFAIDHETLYKFLTSPLNPEAKDIHDRTHKKLQEPKLSLEQAFQQSLQITPEERYNSAITMLEQWNSEYARKASKENRNYSAILAAKMEIDVDKQRAYIEELDKIMETVYATLKGTPEYKKIQKSLMEASKAYLYAKHDPHNQEKINNANNAILAVLDRLGIKEKTETENNSKTNRTENHATSLAKLREHPQPTSTPLVNYQMHPEAKSVSYTHLTLPTKRIV